MVSFHEKRSSQVCFSNYETEQAIIEDEIEDLIEIVQAMTTIASECLTGVVPIAVDNIHLSTICFGLVKSEICKNMDFLNMFRKERV